MYEITDYVYQRLAELLIDEIGARDFFSGAVIYQDGEVECRLVCTAIVTHHKREPRAIVSIVPVWWEMHSTIGEEMLCNDFSFSEMLAHVDLK